MLKVWKEDLRIQKKKQKGPETKIKMLMPDNTQLTRQLSEKDKMIKEMSQKIPSLETNIFKLNEEIQKKDKKIEDLLEQIKALKKTNHPKDTKEPGPEYEHPTPKETATQKQGKLWNVCFCHMSIYL